MLDQFVDVKQTLAQTIHLDSIAVITDSNTSDSINISLIVMEQIKQAKLKSELDAKQLTDAKDTTIIANQVSSQTENNDSIILTTQLPIKPEGKNEMNAASIMQTELKDSGGIDSKVAILSGAAVIAIGFISFRRIKFSKKSGVNKLKKNINLMREEKFVRSTDKKLSQLRSKLRMNAEYFSMKENSVSAKAKGLNISKGELMLAAKIKSFELSESCSPRQ